MIVKNLDPRMNNMKSQHLLPFLIGLNESYNNIRSNVLAKRHVVTVNEAYAIVTQEESQRLFCMHTLE